jgi:asparaginyl-tRNA synthetase
MESATIEQLGRHEGKVVSLQGWLYGMRKSGKVVFLELRDGTGICQCVVEASAAEAFENARILTQESSLVLEGLVRAEPRAIGGYEISATKVQPLQVAQEYPISRKAHGPDFLMSHRHLWLRSSRPAAILKVRHTIIKACRDFFDSNGFTLIDTPILVARAGEDAQTLFHVDYFEKQAFLAQTGQLYLESACMSLGKVYCFGPTFRAEKSKTRRHLTEFWMVEPEVAFADLDDVMELAEDMICAVVEAVLHKHQKELELLGRDIETLKKVCKPFPRITYSDAVDVLKSEENRTRMKKELQLDKEQLEDMKRQHTDLENQLANVSKAWKQEKLKAEIREMAEAIAELERDVKNRPGHIRLAAEFEWGADLGGSDETIISSQFEKPVFVTDYPKEAKAFYMKQSVEDPRVVRNMDLLAPEGYGEIIGGSQREDDLEVLRTKMQEMQLNEEDYSWYLDLRRYGSVPHGGFGLGIERAISWICGLKHVRETIPFPRTMGRMEP